VTREQERESAALMKLAQSGDQSSYASLLVLLTVVTRHYARSRIGAVPWVEDVVQETLMAVHAARHTYDSQRPFGPWFYAIAGNRLIDVLRRERRVSSREIAQDVLPDVPIDRGASVRGEIDVDAIHAAVAMLPARQREVVQSLKLQEESVREVAGRLRMSESAVKVTAHRGYRTLKRLLGVRTRED